MTTHGDRLVLSVWRDDECAATVHLGPAEAAAVVAALAEGIADLADPVAQERPAG